MSQDFLQNIFMNPALAVHCPVSAHLGHMDSYCGESTHAIAKDNKNKIQIPVTLSQRNQNITSPLALSISTN